MLLAKRQGFDVEQVRELAGDNLHNLSAAQASALIERFGGGDLPYKPGQKPGPYAGKKRPPGVIRMITADHTTQILRLGLAAFDESAASFYAWWLTNNFKVKSIRELATAERAGHVIRVLKEMLKRKESHNETPL